MTGFDGFSPISVQGVHGMVGGSGPPLLLLHGYPQTHTMWHEVVAGLAESHTVVATDLRGYGDSHRPADVDDRHTSYSKRAMADEQVSVMSALGFDRFDVAGHDRGARVTHRLCLDHPGRVGRAAVLDIVPTRYVFEHADMAMAMAYYHWFFLAQQADLPERLIGSDPDRWLRHHVTMWARLPERFAPSAIDEYVRCFDPASVHATCEDYRAGATIDLEHDRVDAGRPLTMPVLALYGARGFVGTNYDVAAVWAEYAEDVTTIAADCGHFVPEEAPEFALSALRNFFG